MLSNIDSCVNPPNAYYLCSRKLLPFFPMKDPESCDPGSDWLLTILLLFRYTYFTVTVQVRTTFPAFTVITAVPAFFAVTLPLEFTAAILLLEDLKEIFASAPDGVSFGLMVKDFPFFKVFAAATPVIPVGGVGATFTLTTTFFFPDFTVIFAVPAFFATICPFEETVATFLLEDE